MSAKTTPIQGWTPAQQWMPGGGWGADPRSDYGHGNPAGAIVLADELGPRLSHLGRASLVEKCFAQAKADASSALVWAVCGNDVATLDFRKLEAELVAEGIGPQSRATVVGKAKEHHEKAKAVGAAVEAAAKDDPGVAAVVKLGAAGQSEWAAYAKDHHPEIDRYLALKDGVRSGNSGHKAFAGCYEATRPPVAKLVKATKFPWDEAGDPLPFYISFLVKSPAGYVNTVAYAACAWSIDASGEGLYAAAANQGGGVARIGPRSLTLANAMAESFAPKFANRSLSLEDMRTAWKRGMKMSGVNENTAIATPGGGKVAQVKKNGDSTMLKFSGDKVDACLEWKETNKVAHVTPNGSVSYQKVCVKRGMIANQASDVEVATKFAGGIAPGVSVTTVNRFPVVAWKNRKLTAVLGIPL